jgi:anti-sigma regulatory factor (Ser/Thr protein kinase)
MKTTVIKIARAKENMWEEFNDFLAYLHAVCEEAPEKVVFDFGGCEFFSPHITGGIVSVSKSLIEKGCKVEFIHPQDATLLSYLDTIYFPHGVDFVGSTPESINRSLMRYHQKNYLPIICFPTNYADLGITEKIMTAVNTIFRNQLKLDGNILQAITYMVDELTQNILDHSKSPQGLICAQYYPNKHYMDLCIADWGKGIYQSYTDSGKFIPKDNAEALQYAVKGKSTKDRAESRGFGLSTSRKMLVQGLGGKFLLLSGDSFFIEMPDRKEDIINLKLVNYQGCYVALRVPTQNVPGFDFYRFVE